MTNNENRDRMIEVVTSRSAYSTGQKCQGGGCPAVYRSESGAYFVIGRRLGTSEKTMLPMDGIEDAVEVPADLIELLRNHNTLDD